MASTAGDNQLGVYLRIFLRARQVGSNLWHSVQAQIESEDLTISRLLPMEFQGLQEKNFGTKPPIAGECQNRFPRRQK